MENAGCHAKRKQKDSFMAEKINDYHIKLETPSINIY